MTACMSAFTRVGVNMSRADVLHRVCTKCSTYCWNAEGQRMSAQMMLSQLWPLVVPLVLQQQGCCRLLGWEEPAGLMQADKSREETGRRGEGVLHADNATMSLEASSVSGSRWFCRLIHHHNFTESSLGPRSLPQVQVIPPLTHTQGREINSLDRVSNR